MGAHSTGEGNRVTSAGGLSVGSVQLEAEIQLVGSQAANQGSEVDTKAPPGWQIVMRAVTCGCREGTWKPPPLVLFLDSALRMSL